MTVIRPFQGIRPASAVVEQVAALPYDVYSREEARAAVVDKPLSFLNIDRAETGLPQNLSMYDEQVYTRAHDVLWGMREQGILIQDETPYLYLYELIMNGRSQTGIVGCASIDDYRSGVIKKHENTRADKEEDRIRHVDRCQAQTGPIFLTYRRNNIIQGVIQETKQEEPIYNFVSEDGITHRVWIVLSETARNTIINEFNEIPEVYIADGHHRAASAVKVGLQRRDLQKAYDKDAEFNYFLSVFFPSEELRILDYNRVVEDLNGLTEEQFLKALSQNFEIHIIGDVAYRPKEKYMMGMYLNHVWYQVVAKEEVQSRDVVKALDVSILQDYVLEPILGIPDPKTNERISFVGGIKGLRKLEEIVNQGGGVAFAMYPTSMEELMCVAKAGKLMPPKSTWFEPKLRSGLFIHQIS
ncbi:DUF1015 domain-containing protein [Lachnospiraceae bacterium LCP25S3_G4]